MNILAHIGRGVLALCEEVGRVTLFLKDSLLQGLTPKIYVRQILDQMLKIGYFSLPVVGLTAFFTGGASSGTSSGAATDLPRAFFFAGFTLASSGGASVFFARALAIRLLELGGGGL